MNATAPDRQPTLDFYRRDGCEPCEEARAVLQAVMEERVIRGDRIPRVRYRNVDESADLEATFGARIPVLAVGADELSLTVSHRAIATFLDRVMGRAA
jgi:hypothetical protein